MNEDDINLLFARDNKYLGLNEFSLLVMKNKDILNFYQT